MNYKNELLRVMVEVGDEGLSLKKIAMHVYNSNTNLFESPDFDKIYNGLSQYLSKQSKMSDGLVKRIGARGVYAINKKWSGYQQVMLDFTCNDDEEAIAENQSTDFADKSLSLFDDY